MIVSNSLSLFSSCLKVLFYVVLHFLNENTPSTEAFLLCVCCHKQGCVKIKVLCECRGCEVVPPPSPTQKPRRRVPLAEQQAGAGWPVRDPSSHGAGGKVQGQVVLVLLALRSRRLCISPTNKQTNNSGLFFPLMTSYD